MDEQQRQPIPKSMLWIHWLWLIGGPPLFMYHGLMYGWTDIRTWIIFGMCIPAAAYFWLSYALKKPTDESPRKQLIRTHYIDGITMILGSVPLAVMAAMFETPGMMLLVSVIPITFLLTGTWCIIWAKRHSG